MRVLSGSNLDRSDSIASRRSRSSRFTGCNLRVQFAQLLTNRAGSEIDMSVLNRKSDYFDTLQVPCSDPGFFRETQRVVAPDEGRSATLCIRIVAHHCHPDSVHVDGVAA